jgi:hypothetical protein
MKLYATKKKILYKIIILGLNFKLSFFCVSLCGIFVQFFAYKMTEAIKNPMLKHRNVDLNTVSLKASDCTSTKVKYLQMNTVTKI